MSLTFLAAADLHLGRASSGSNLSDTRTFPEFGQPVPVSSATHAWLDMVEQAVSRKVCAVLLAGDVIDRDNHYFEARTALLAGFRRLKGAGIPVIMVCGNHDADVLPEFVRMNKLNNVHLLGKGGEWEELILNFNGVTVGFVGWSFPTSHFRNNPLTSLSLSPASHRRIGLLHGDFAVPNSPYAPLTAATLEQSPVDAWVLGHVHKPQTLLENPLVFYPGSPQALSAKEQGLHGCVFCDYESMSMNTISLSTVIYDKIEVDVTGVVDGLDGQSRLQTAVQMYLANLPEHKAAEFIVDVVWKGIMTDPSLPSTWQFSENLGMIEGVLCSVRTISNSCTLSLPDLAELARDTGLAAILAQAILDIEAGRDSEFLQKLRDQSADHLRKLNMHNAYKPLGNDDRVQPTDISALNLLILEECRAMLSSLFQTKGAS